jgi:hypothetical protein
MINQGSQSAEIGEALQPRSMSERQLTSLVLVPLVAAVVIAGSVPWLMGYAPYGQQATDQQIDREDGALCEKFGFPSGAQQYSDCKVDLADLRRRHELLLVR